MKIYRGSCVADTPRLEVEDPCMLGANLDADLPDIIYHNLFLGGFSSIMIL